MAESPNHAAAGAEAATSDAGKSQIVNLPALVAPAPGAAEHQVEDKVAECLGAGVPIVWVVSPNTHSVRIHRPRSSPRGSVSGLTSEDAIDGEDVLVGFTCPVRDFFA